MTPLRRRVKRRRQQAIIDEVRKEIRKRTVQERTNAFTQEKQRCKERLPDCRTGCVRSEAATAEATRQEEPCPVQPGVKTKDGQAMYQYQCPFCQETVNSTVEKLSTMRLPAGKSSVWLAAVSLVAFTRMHAQPAEQLFIRKRQRAESMPRTEMLLDAHAARKCGR